MNVRYDFTSQAFFETISNCFDYMLDETDEDLIHLYVDNIEEVVKTYHSSGLINAWRYLIATSVFQDSEGKIETIGEDYVIVITDY